MAAEKEKKPNILFEILNSLFTSKEYVSSITDETAKQSLFMINRRIAIKYPMQAQVFNNNKVNPKDVIKFWSDFLYTGSRPPGWIYTSGAVKSQAKKAEKNKVTPTMIKEYCKKFQLSAKDVETAMRFYPEEIIEEILDYDNLRKQLEAYEKTDI